MTRDQTPAHNTITVEKFAKRVASAVCRFIDVSLVFWGLRTRLTLWHAGGIEDAGPGTRGALADRPWCHHQGRCHHHRRRSCLTRKLATHSPAETLRVLKIPPFSPLCPTRHNVPKCLIVNLNASIMIRTLIQTFLLYGHLFRNMADVGRAGTDLAGLDSVSWEWDCRSGSWSSG
jgi:hypothetical protein